MKLCASLLVIEDVAYLVYSFHLDFQNPVSVLHLQVKVCQDVLQVVEQLLSLKGSELGVAIAVSPH